MSTIKIHDNVSCFKCTRSILHIYNYITDYHSTLRLYTTEITRQKKVKNFAKLYIKKL